MNNKNDITTRHKIALAALLHDIGKFWQRVDERDWKAVVNSISLDHVNIVVPIYQNGYPKYQHALWTQTFFEKYVMPKLGNNDNSGIDLATLSSKHHQPSTKLEGIISLADKWSSGIDRVDFGEDTDNDSDGYTWAKNTFGSGFVSKVPLHSVFDGIQVSGKRNQQSHFYNILSLELSDQDRIFPHKCDVDNGGYTLEKREKYEKHWESFIEEFQQIDFHYFNQYYSCIYSLLKKYCWCIPSATNYKSCSVSLFEHLKTTAGLALALYDHYQANKEQWIDDVSLLIEL